LIEEKYKNVWKYLKTAKAASDKIKTYLSLRVPKHNLFEYNNQPLKENALEDIIKKYEVIKIKDNYDFNVNQNEIVKIPYNSQYLIDNNIIEIPIIFSDNISQYFKGETKETELFLVCVQDYFYLDSQLKDILDELQKVENIIDLNDLVDDIENRGNTDKSITVKSIGTLENYLNNTKTYITINVNFSEAPKKGKTKRQRHKFVYYVIMASNGEKSNGIGSIMGPFTSMKLFSYSEYINKYSYLNKLIKNKDHGILFNILSTMMKDLTRFNENFDYKLKLNYINLKQLLGYYFIDGIKNLDMKGLLKILKYINDNNFITDPLTEDNMNIPHTPQSQLSETNNSISNQSNNLHNIKKHEIQNSHSIQTSQNLNHSHTSSVHSSFSTQSSVLSNQLSDSSQFVGSSSSNPSNYSQTNTNQTMLNQTFYNQMHYIQSPSDQSQPSSSHSQTIHSSPHLKSSQPQLTQQQSAPSHSIHIQPNQVQPNLSRSKPSHSNQLPSNEIHSNTSETNDTQLSKKKVRHKHKNKSSSSPINQQLLPQSNSSQHHQSSSSPINQQLLPQSNSSQHHQPSNDTPLVVQNKNTQSNIRSGMFKLEKEVDRILKKVNKQKQTIYEKIRQFEDETAQIQEKLNIQKKDLQEEINNVKDNIYQRDEQTVKDKYENLQTQINTFENDTQQSLLKLVHDKNNILEDMQKFESSIERKLEIKTKRYKEKMDQYFENRIGQLNQKLEECQEKCDLYEHQLEQYKKNYEEIEQQLNQHFRERLNQYQEQLKKEYEDQIIEYTSIFFQKYQQFQIGMSLLSKYSNTDDKSKSNIDKEKLLKKIVNINPEDKEEINIDDVINDDHTLDNSIDN